MASAYTYTGTSTYTRIILLGMQIRIALKRTTNIDEKILELFIEKGVKKNWIKSFTVYGLDSSGLCRAELELNIDWDEHSLQMSYGRTRITIDERWKDNAAIEVDEAVRLFEKFCRANSLQSKWVVSYTSNVWNNQALLDKVRRELHLSPADKVSWAGNKQGVSLEVPELPELKVGLYFVE